MFYTGFFGSLDLTTPRESFRGPTLPRFHKGNSGGELAVAAWQLTEADSGGPSQSFWGGSLQWAEQGSISKKVHLNWQLSASVNCQAATASPPPLFPL